MTDRNWKDLSKKTLELEEGEFFLLSNPEYPLDILPEGAALHRYEDPVVGGDETPTTKEIRTFFWSQRKERRLTRPTAVIWRKGNTFGLGAITPQAALERLGNG